MALVSEIRETSAGVQVRPADVVCRGSPSPSREGGGKGPRRTDSPHPCRGGKFSKSKPGIPRSRGLCPRAPTPTSGEFGSGQRSRSSGGRRSSVAGLGAPCTGSGARDRPTAQPGGQGQGPASDRLPASLRPSVSSRKSLRVPSPESRGGRGAVPSVESRPIFRAARRDSVRDFCPNGPGRRVRPSIPHAGEPIPAGQQVLTRRASRTSARTGWSSDLWSNGYFRHLSTTPQSLFRLR